MYEIQKMVGDNGEFERAVFVAKAISADTTRPFMCVIHVENTRTGSRFVATDGRRLHVAEMNQKIEPGDYTPVVTRNSVILRGPLCDLTFPNWKRVVPEKTVDRGVIDFADTDLGKKISKTAEMSIAFSSVLEKTGEVVNIRYLEDLPKAEWKLLSTEDKRRAIVFKRDEAGREVYAVIMPLNVAA